MQEKIKKVYDLLADTESKYIFENRLLYSFTEDFKFMRNIIYIRDSSKELYKNLENKNTFVGIFGAGKTGRDFLFRYGKDICVSCFIDNYKAGGELLGIPIIGLKEFKQKYQDGIVVIPLTKYYKDFYRQLMEEDFDEGKIINEMPESIRLSHLQYFELPQPNGVSLEKEVFVDGGAFDGATSLDFLNWSAESKARFIYAWEPDLENQKKCRKLFDRNQVLYSLIPKGLWDKSETLNFKMQGNSCSLVCGNGGEAIEVDSIDNVIKEPVTFIKMDIEGSEYKALLGAKNMIMKHKPKLAISIYHKTEDIWEIPYLIYQFNPLYKFYLKHYSLSDNETILYAL